MEHLLESCGITASFDVIGKRLHLIDLDGNHVTAPRVTSLATLNGLNVGLVYEFVQDVADRNAHNPVADWIRSTPWDGEDRLPAVYATVVAREEYPNHLKEILLRRWLLSATAAAIVPEGFHSRGVLTFQGPQGCGKTSWGKRLISDPALAARVIKVDHHLDGGNKDSILGAINHWITEIGELDSSFKKDVARLKGFLTNSCDKLRRPYARAEAEYPRRTVFFATVNEHNFLVDQTGNSRWWTIAVERLEFEHQVDMQQVFAQLATLVEAGEQWWLSPDEEAMLEAWNKGHRAVSALRERMLENIALDHAGDGRLKPLTAMQVLKQIGIAYPSNAQCREAGSILRELIGPSKRIKGRDQWRVPFIKPEPITSVNLRDEEDIY